jgi:hypothetical protein
MCEKLLSGLLRFCTRALPSVTELVLCTLPHRHGLLERIIRTLLKRFSNSLRLACSLACRCGSSERRVKGNPLIAPPRLPRLQQVDWKAETLGNRKCLRAAWGANDESVRWPQRYEIEFNGAVDNSLRDMCVLLKLGIVTRC